MIHNILYSGGFEFFAQNITEKQATCQQCM